MDKIYVAYWTEDNALANPVAVYASEGSAKDAAETHIKEVDVAVARTIYVVPQDEGFLTTGRNVRDFDDMAEGFIVTREGTAKLGEDTSEVGATPHAEHPGSGTASKTFADNTDSPLPPGFGPTSAPIGNDNPDPAKPPVVEQTDPQKQDSEAGTMG